MGITYVVDQARLKCTQGIGESTLSKAVDNDTRLHEKTLLTVTDSKPYENIQAFPLCKSGQNPSVIAADMKPSTCQLNICMNWMNGAIDFFIKGEEVLKSDSQVMCLYGGVIEIIDDGQRKI